MEKPTKVRFPNGEKFPEIRSRVLSAFEGLQRKHEGETIAIVSHGGVNRIVLAAALEIPDRCIFRLAQDYAAVNLLVFLQMKNEVLTVCLKNGAQSSWMWFYGE